MNVYTTPKGIRIGLLYQRTRQLNEDELEIQSILLQSHKERRIKVALPLILMCLFLIGLSL